MNRLLLKTFALIFLLNLVENILLLLFFGVDITIKQTLISVILFTVTLTTLLSQFKVVKEA